MHKHDDATIHFSIRRLLSVFFVTAIISFVCWCFAEGWRKCARNPRLLQSPQRQVEEERYSQMIDRDLPPQNADGSWRLVSAQ